MVGLGWGAVNVGFQDGAMVGVAKMHPQPHGTWLGVGMDDSTRSAAWVIASLSLITQQSVPEESLAVLPTTSAAWSSDTSNATQGEFRHRAKWTKFFLLDLPAAWKICGIKQMELCCRSHLGENNAKSTTVLSAKSARVERRSVQS